MHWLRPGSLIENGQSSSRLSCVLHPADRLLIFKRSLSTMIEYPKNDKTSVSYFYTRLTHVSANHNEEFITPYPTTQSLKCSLNLSLSAMNVALYFPSCSGGLITDKWNPFELAHMFCVRRATQPWLNIHFYTCLYIWEYYSCDTTVLSQLRLFIH